MGVNKCDWITLKMNMIWVLMIGSTDVDVKMEIHIKSTEMAQFLGVWKLFFIESSDSRMKALPLSR